ncbi:glycosyltransferase family 4 protein [Leptolyngbya sp. NIES-2104]|uniref:glycosyltransferase family 4 protein n=1 Tax=Leptolyngbya sp. NIES-2104 TaxID=1552121 RepID=UPI0006EC9A3A|nr:glycosyltransferase family 4 protein [Leptolyngbya sp. NIES-2104]GAP95126.1 glycosyl transferase, group 1 family protein [Leptolyngbya sp. NIES-2104]
MRILHLYAGNLFGGIETYLVTLAKTSLPQMQHEFALCFQGRLSSELQQAGAIVHNLGAVQIRHPWTVWKARSQLKALLQQKSFDVIIAHACWVQAIFGSVVKAQNLPLVFYAHNIVSGREWLERLAKRIVPDLVIANSNYTASTLNHLYPEVPSRTVYFPVLSSQCLDSTVVRQRIRSQFQTPADRVVIAQVSRLEECKGHRSLLVALSQLKSIPDWEMWLVGGPQRAQERTYLASLQKQLTELQLVDRVKFLGQRSDVSELLAAADLYCQPNRHAESFGISLIEALYAGLPIVTTAIGAAPEIVDQSCGCLVPAGDNSAIAQVLERLITDARERDRLSQGCLDRAISLCDPVQQLNKLYEILERSLFEKTPELSTF